MVGFPVSSTTEHHRMPVPMLLRSTLSSLELSVLSKSNKFNVFFSSPEPKAQDELL